MWGKIEEWRRLKRKSEKGTNEQTYRQIFKSLGVYRDRHIESWKLQRMKEKRYENTNRRIFERVLIYMDYQSNKSTNYLTESD